MKAQLAKLLAGQSLTEDEAGAAMGTIMDGQATPAQIGALLAALTLRGETEDEVVGFARTMRARAVPIRSTRAVDVVGTGGDGAGTLNVSTLASLVVAACGVSVAKHGNRAASGRCGAADVLEGLGVKIDPAVETVQRCLDEVGWTFLFAPAFHAATRHAVGPRKELGVRTTFNLLGPLTNPACPEGLVVGVARAELVPFIARCLARLGARRAWVVHGAGLDEIALDGPTSVAAVDGDKPLSTFSIAPEDAGLVRAPREACLGGDTQQNVAIAQGILQGERGPRREIVVLNAAAGLVVAGRASNLREGAALAAQALDSGAARKLVERVKEVTRA
jgi:anthranilate phosphoribosyltransferase